MKILIITHYFEPDSGAAAVRLSRLAHLLKDDGHDVSVLTTMPHYPVGKIADGYRWKVFASEQRDGLKVYRSWLWATPSSKISRKLISQLTFMMTVFFRGLFLSRPDAILVEAQPMFTGFAGRWISWLKRAPMVLNVSDLWPDHLVSVGAVKESDLIYRTARKLVDGNYKSAKTIVAMSNGWATNIKKHVPDSNVVVVYNGVDLKKFRPDHDTSQFRKKYRLEGSKTVAFVGTFATQYDIQLMLDAAEHFSGLDENTEFLFIGSGSLQNEIIAGIERIGRANVRHIAWLDHEEIPIAWNCVDIAFWAMRTHPLYDGTIPAKLFEIMASGVPVVAAHGQECAKLVNQSGCGIIVSPGQGEELFSALHKVLDDSELRQQFSRAGREFAENELCAQRVTTKYESVLMDSMKPN